MARKDQYAEVETTKEVKRIPVQDAPSDNRGTQRYTGVGRNPNSKIQPKSKFATAPPSKQLPQDRQEQGQPQRDLGPATTAATGNVLNARINLAKDMEKNMQSNDVANYQKRAAALGVTRSGFSKVVDGMGQDRMLEEKVAAIRTPPGQAPAGNTNAVAPASAAGAPPAAATTPPASNSAVSVRPPAAPSAPAGQRVRLTPEQAKNSAAATSLSDLPTDERMRIQGKTNRGKAEGVANASAISAAVEAKVDPQSLRSKFAQPGAVRNTALTEDEGKKGYQSIAKGAAAPKGMELVGVRGGNSLYAPMKEVYGEAPTGVATKALNVVKAATGYDAPKALKTEETIRASYQDKMRKGFQSTGQMQPPGAPRSGFAKPPAGSGPAPASQPQPSKDPMSRYSPETYARTDAARASGFRKQEAMKQAATGALSSAQKQEFSDIIDKPTAAGMGLLPKTTQVEASQPKSKFGRRGII